MVPAPFAAGKGPGPPGQAEGILEECLSYAVERPCDALEPY